MVRILKGGLFWSFLLFISIIILSVLSKWFEVLDLGIFNYSLLVVSSLLLPNLELVYKELKNSEVEKIKLPFCELKLLKKYDYYFIGYWKEDESGGDLVVLEFYKGLLSEKEATYQFEKEFPNKKTYEVIEVVKQVHYKKNDS